LNADDSRLDLNLHTLLHLIDHTPSSSTEDG
jgi:hypothetical protein